MNTDLSQQIDLFLNAQPAIKTADEAGKEIEQALSLKIEDPTLKARQDALRKEYEYAQFIRKYIKEINVDSKQIELSEEKQANLERLKTDQLEQQAKAISQAARVKTLSGNLEKQLAEDPSGGWTARTARLLEGAQALQDQYNQSLAQTTAQIAALNAEKLELKFVGDDAVENIRAYSSGMLGLASSAQDLITQQDVLEHSIERTASAEAGALDEYREAADAIGNLADSEERLGNVDINDNGVIERTAADANLATEAMEEVNQATQAVGTSASETENDISRLIKRIAELKRDIAAVETGKKAVSIDEYRAMNNELLTSQRLLKIYRGQLDETAQSSKQHSRATKTSSRSMRTFATEVKDTIKALKGSMKTLRSSGDVFGKITSYLHSMQSSMKHLRSSFKRGFSNFTKYILGFKSFYYLVRRLRKFIVEGLENLAQYNDKVNKNVKSHNLFNDAMNDLRTSLLYLKNSWAAAFAPIVIYVMPVLTGLIDYLAVAGNALARFIAKLTGQENAYNALKVQAQDYADSLDKAGDSAKKNSDKQKKLNQSLADYDKLLVIAQKNDTDDSPNNGSGSGANVYTPNVQDMFTVVDSADGLADALIKAFSEGGWAALGTTISDSIANAFDNIPWNDIKTKVGKKAKDVGDFINGFFGNTNLWDSFGVAAGDALNTVTIALREFMEPIDTFKIGWNASSGLRHFLTTVDWKSIGTNINTAWTKITDGIKGFLDNFPSEDAANAILSFVDGLNIPQMVESGLTVLVKGIVTVVDIAKQVVVQGAENLSNKLVADVSTVKISSYTQVQADGTLKQIDLQIKPDIDWTEHPIMALIDQGFTDLGEFTMKIITGGDYDTLLTFMDFFTREIEVPQWFYDLVYNVEFPSLDDFVKNCQDLIEIWAQDFTSGNLFSILTWLEGFLEDGPVKKLDELQQSFNEWVTGTFSQEDLKKWRDFGTVMQTIGQYLLEGAFTGGILPAINTVKSYFNDPEFKKKIDDNPIVKTLKGIGAALGQSFKDPIGTIKDALFGKKDENGKVLSKGILSYFEGTDGIVQKIKQKLGLGDNDTIGIVGALKKAFTNPLSAIKTALFSDKNGLMQYFTGDGSIIKKIKDKLIGAGGIKDTFVSAFKEVSGGVEGILKGDVLKNIGTAIKKIWEGWDEKITKGTQYGKTIHHKGIVEWFKDMFDAVLKGIKAPINNIIKWIYEHLVKKVIDAINILTGALKGLSITIPKIGGGSTTYGFSFPKLDYPPMPQLAKGAVIPPNKEFMAVLGDQKQGVNIETPLATMIDAFKTALAEGGGNTNHEPIVLQLDGRTVAQVVWDEEDKKYKQTGFGLAY